MRIAFVGERTCIRVTKQTMALHKAGHEVHLISKALQTPSWYTTMAFVDCPKKLGDTIRLYAPFIDIFVVHNEPSWPVAIIKEEAPDKKVILEYHDSKYWYLDRDKEIVLPNEKISWYEEDYSLACADGVIVPSPACAEEVRTRTDKPVEWVPPAAILDEYRYQSHNFCGGLVSQGGHTIPGHYMRPGEHWRDYTKLYKWLKGRQQIYAYSPDFQVESHRKYYENLGVKCNILGYGALIDAIGESTWNLVGNWCYHDVWKYSAPNKFYDALAAGTPSVVFNTKFVIDLFKDYDIGIVVNHPDELLKRWEEHREKRANLMKVRREFCMESYVPKIIGFYNKILGA